MLVLDLMGHLYAMVERIMRTDGWTSRQKEMSGVKSNWRSHDHVIRRLRLRQLRPHAQVFIILRFTAIDPMNIISFPSQ